MLLEYKVTDEHERQILTQLDMIQQKSTIQEYNVTFEKLTMQIAEMPLRIEMHYYLKGLKKELRQLIESNRENLKDMMTLKLACLRQDQIVNPQVGMNNKKTSNDTALMTFNDRGNSRGRSRSRGRGRGRGIGRGTFTGRGFTRGTFRGGFNTGFNIRSFDRGGYSRGGYSKHGYDGSHGRTQNTYQGNCLACGEFGHIIMDCPAVKETVEKKQREKMMQIQRVNDNRESTFFTTVTERDDNEKLKFVLDSGSTLHMTPHRELLLDIKPSIRQIKAAGDSVLNIEAEGKIVTKLEDNNYFTQATVENVLYTPKLRESLLSIAAINDHGYDVTFKRNGYVWITDIQDSIVAEGHREGNLYYLDIRVNKDNDIVTEYTFKANEEQLSTYMLWHLKIGHLGIQNMQKL